jgi:hypothetical protein
VYWWSNLFGLPPTYAYCGHIAPACFRYDYEKYKGQSWKTLNSQIYDRFSTRRTTFNYDNADEGLLL